MSPHSIKCAALAQIDGMVSPEARLWRRRMFRDSGTSHWLSRPLSGTERFMVGAFRFWKWSRATNSATLPSLHSRLAPAGGTMLAVPFNDFFRLISDFCACSRLPVDTGGRILRSDEVTLLTLLHAHAPRPRQPTQPAAPTEALSPLLLVAAWAVRQQLAAELGLRFGPTPNHEPARLTAPGPSGLPRLAADPPAADFTDIATVLSRQPG